MIRLVGDANITDTELVVERGDKDTVRIPLSAVEAVGFHRSGADYGDGALEVRANGREYSIAMPNEDGPVFVAELRGERHQGEDTLPGL